jgi:Fe2+ or Zn2+ uptake regulation protein
LTGVKNWREEWKTVSKYGDMVLNIVLGSKEHPTAEQIFIEAKHRNPKIVQATVYNNLKTLLTQDKIIRISCPGQPDRYDNTTKHDHMVCTECGELFDIKLDDFTQTIEEQLGFDIESYQLIIRFVCPSCRKAKQAD